MKNRRLRADYYAAYEKRRNQEPKRIAAQRQGQKVWKANNHEKVLAHQRLSYAIQHGKIKRGKYCEICLSVIKVEAHHDDYSAPLTVRWLCKTHHQEADAVRRNKEMRKF